MKNLFLLAFFLLTTQAQAQEDAWVYFNAKPNSQFYFNNPLEMLSQRALDRRSTQNIALDFLDIPIHQPYVDQIDAMLGITVMAQSKWLNAVHVRGSVTSINSLAALSFVASIDFADNSLDTGKNTIPKAATPNVPVNKMLETEVNFAYGTSGNQIQMLNGHLLHQQNYTGTGKIIAVMDAGFPEVDVAAPFQRLFDNNLILGGYNFVDRNDDFYSRNSHGTLVLSTMGGYVENQLVGTAPDASYYLFITEDTNSENPVEESYWVEAAETADSLGVDVINTSLGYFIYDNPNYSYTYNDMNGTTSFVSRGADIAFSRGMVVVASAGNSGNTANVHIGVPADAINVLAVGAVNAGENYASFSSIGPSFDGRVKPDVAAQGQQAVLSNTDGVITTASGTSFSGPITAGMIASFWQALPDKTNAEIIQLVKESASLFAAPTVQLGYGIPDFSLALANALAIADFNTSEFRIYPNPAQNEISLAFPDAIGIAQLTLYTIIGQEIRTETVSRNAPTLSLESLDSGIYLYKIQSGTYVKTGKIIKH